MGKNAKDFAKGSVANGAVKFQPGTSVRLRTTGRQMVSCVAMGCHLRCALFLGLVGVALLAIVASNLPRQLASERVSAHEFSTARALQIVNVIARQPHTVGTSAHRATREFIATELTRLGLVATEQASGAALRMAGSEHSASVHNLLATIPGRDPHAKAILLAAHYDSVPNSRGAGDDGAAIASLIETARALLAGPKLRRDVLLLFTDAEEDGLLGAQAFVSQHPAARHVGVALNFEARGSRGPVLMYQTSPNNGELIRDFGRFTSYPHANSLISSLARILPNDSDASIFVRAGYSVLAFAFVEGLEHYHRYHDSPENLDSRSLAHCGSQMLSLARQLGQVEHLPEAAADAVYFDVFGRVLIRYPSVFAKLLGSLCALGWFALIRREMAAGRVTGSGIARGMKLQFLAIGIALVVPVMLHFLRSLTIDSSCLVRNAPVNGFADFLVVTALNLLFFGSMIRAVAVRELVLGGLTLGVLLSVTLGWLMPAASAPWQWVTALSLVVWRIEPTIKPHHIRSRITWQHVPLAGVALLFGPLVSSAMAAAGPVLMAIPLVIASTVAGLVLPTLLQREFSRLYQLSIGATFFGFALMFGVALYPRTGQAKEHEDSIIYAYDTESKTACYASEDITSDPWTSKLIPASTPAKRFGIFSSGPELWRQAKAPVLPLQTPQVSIGELASIGSQRQVELRITSVEPARCVKLWQVAGPAVKTLSVNQKPIAQFVRFSPEFDELGLQLYTGLRGRHGWNLKHCGLGDRPLIVKLQVPRQPGVKLRLVEERDSLPEAVRSQLGPRPLGFVPGPNSDVTWIAQDIALPP